MSYEGEPPKRPSGFETDQPPPRVVHREPELDTAERRTLIGELVLVREALAKRQTLDEQLLAALDSLKAGQLKQGHELGHIKTHLTEQALRTSDPVTPNGLQRRRVLVVEDEIQLLRIAAKKLGTVGALVTTASDRAEAERHLAAETFDAALVDLHLPHARDGLELCRWISRVYPQTGIVVMSGLFEAPGLDEIPALRLCKPFSLERLVDVLEEAIARAEPAAAETVRPPPPPSIDPPLSALEFEEPKTPAETPEALRRGG
ncbi:MAG TPA: response regulator [Polyangiaceae bacterium]